MILRAGNPGGRGAGLTRRMDLRSARSGELGITPETLVATLE